MKISVSTYSFGGQNDDSRLGVAGVIGKAAEMGFDGIEFVESGKTNLNDAPSLREKCLEAGIEPVCFCVGANLALEDKSALDDEVKRIKGLVDVAEALGVKMLRHDATGGHFSRKYKIGFADVLPYIVEGTREITKYAEQKGIKTMTENHGLYAQDAQRVEMLVNAVGHPNYGALVDIGNFMCADENPNLSVGLMTPYAFHVHCKDFFFKSGREASPGNGWFKSRGGNYLRGTVIGYGSAGVSQSIATLINGGYDGYFSVEFEGGEDTFYGIETGRDNLRRYIDAAKA